MSKLLFIFERDMPTISIMQEIFTHLEHYSEIRSNFIYLADVKPSDIDAHDVIIFMRPNNVYAWKIADEVKKAGHIVVTFCDDDLLNLPSLSPTIPWRKRGLIKCLAHSEVIWSSNKYISNKYRNLTAGKRTAIMDTIVRPEELEGIKFDQNDDIVKIVYAAAPTHATLFEEFIGPIVPKLAEEFGDKISFTFISVHPEIKGVQYEYLAGMPLLEYRKFMKEQHFDIGLAPLHNDEFSKCKYFNKFLEYTTQGIVGIYSKTEPYTYVVKDGLTGFLATNDPESWLEVLKTAIKNRQLRKQCVGNAIEYVKREHSEIACIERIRQDVPEILEATGNYKKCGSFMSQKIKYVLTRPFDWIYLTGFYLKHTGIREVIKRAKKHFVEAKAYNRR